MTTIPQSYICPITQEIMTDPVIDEQGNCYERTAIMTWLQNHNTSPITRSRIDINKLVPNRSLLALIQEFNVGIIQPAAFSPAASEKIEDILLLTESINIRSNFDNKIYKITKTYPSEDYTDKRIPTTLICLIDISGSMGTICNINNTNPAENDNLSRLYLTKHSLLTIVKMLNEHDELILIEFSNDASVVFKGMMTNSEKTLANSAINSLVPTASTNIWSALYAGYEQAKLARTQNIKMLLLTDGESNMNPPRGILPTLERYLNNNNEVRHIELTTFGFSCDVDSKLLYDISHMMKSGFNFIPDASMVGTTFINYLANSLSTCYTSYYIEPIESDIEIIEFDNVPLEYKEKMICYQIYDELKKICETVNSKSRIVTRDTIFKYEGLKDHVLNVLGRDHDIFKDFESDNDQEGQIEKAITNSEWFKKWGYHYILSLSSAHNSQKCHNFKDQSVQQYRSTIFKDLSDEANDIFCTIPKPIQSTNYNQTQVQPARQINMSNYVDRYGGCMSPYCYIKLANGTHKLLDYLDGSEKLYYDGKIESSIKYIVRSYINGKVIMSRNNKDNLIITPWHPVYEANKWVFPFDVYESIEIELPYVINIILESGYHITINDTKCVSMGHQLTEFNESNMILEHLYYGTNLVIEDVEKFKFSDTDKIIDLIDFHIDRNELGLVCGIKK